MPKATAVLGPRRETPPLSVSSKWPISAICTPLEVKAHLRMAMQRRNHRAFDPGSLTGPVDP